MLAPQSATVLMILLGVSALVVAREWVFDPVKGSTASGDGTEASPLGPLYANISVVTGGSAKPGDIVVLRPGDHSNPSGAVIDIRKIDGISFVGSTGKRPVYGDPTLDAPWLGDVQLITTTNVNVQYLHLFQILVDNWNGPSSNVAVKDCLVSPKFEDQRQWTTAAEYDAGCTRGIQFVRGGPYLAERNHVLYGRQSLLFSSDSTIIGNIVEMPVGDSFRVGGSNTLVKQNVILGYLPIDDYHRDCLQVYSATIDLSNITITENFFSPYHPDWVADPSTIPPTLDPGGAQPGDAQGISAFDNNIDGLVMTNNVALVNHHHGSTWQQLTNSLIAFNTIINPRLPTDGDYVGKCWLNIADTTTSSNVTIANNIVGYYIPSIDTSNPGLLYEGNILTSTVGTNPFYVLNVLRDLRGSLDARLNLSSSVPGSGVPSSTGLAWPLTDILGSKRSSAVIDPGAFIADSPPYPIDTILSGLGSDAASVPVVVGFVLGLVGLMLV